MRSRLGWTLLAMTAACGDHVSSGTATTTTNPNSHLDPSSIEGSFDLSFGSVTAVSSFAGQSSPGTTTPPSNDGNARVDVKKNSDGSYAVLVTPRWGQTQKFAADVSAAAVTLTGAPATFQALSSGGGIDDEWTTLSFPRASSGGFVGTFSASGNENIYDGDEGFTYVLSTNGSISKDATAPEARAIIVSQSGPITALLPWDPITIQMAEPIDVSQLGNAFASDSFPADNGPHLEAGSADAFGRTTTTSGVTSNWSGLATAKPNLDLQPFGDPSGNLSIRTILPISFFDVGTPKSSFTFDEASASVANWHDASTSVSVLADATCETGGCVEVATLEGAACTPRPVGFAGILQGNSISSLQVRYRILVGLDPRESAGSSITGESQLVEIQTATPGQLPTTTSFGFQPNDLKTVSPILGMTQATDWTTASFSFSPGDNIGFALRFGDPSFCGGPFFNDNQVIVLIDSITGR